MSTDIGMIGQYRPMIVSPLGLTYLSHCGDAERDAILDVIYSTVTAGDDVANRATIECALADGRHDGFTICHDLEHRRCASMAVPVRVHGDVVACMNVVWHAAELTCDEARDQLSGPLMAARDRVEERLHELTRGENYHSDSEPSITKLAA